MGDYNPPKSSKTFGKAPLDTEGPYKQLTRRIDPREYAEKDRVYRAKWLKAQELSQREMAFNHFYLWDNPDYRKARLNIFRRIWQAPGEAVERALRPALGLKWAFLTKWTIGKALWGTAGVMYLAYYAKYNSGDWTKKSGFKASVSKPPTYTYDESFPLPNPKWEREGPSDYFDHGFKKTVPDGLKPTMPVTW